MRIDNICVSSACLLSGGALMSFFITKFALDFIKIILNEDISHRFKWAAWQ